MATGAVIAVLLFETLEFSYLAHRIALPRHQTVTVPALVATLSLRLFGPGVLTLGSGVVRPHSAKALALLAFLTMESGRPQSRAKLAELLWGNRSDAAARQSLRQALYSLKTLARGRLCDCLQTDHDYVHFEPNGVIDDDVRRFLACVQSTDVQRWHDAVALYRAPLLEGRAFKDCDAFSTWLTGERERLHALAMQNLDRLVVDRMAQADWDAALQYAEALRDLDPTSELVSRHLFLIHAARREPHAVDAEWTRLSGRLRRELEVDPSRETALLHQTVRQGLVAAPVSDTNAIPRAPSVTAGDRRSQDGGKTEAEAFVRAARAAERVCAFSHAADLYSRALPLLKRATPALSVRYCDVLLLREAVLDRLGRRADQLSAIDEAISVARALNDGSRVATGLLRRAGVCTYLREHGEARRAAEHALELCRGIADQPGEAEALRELGFVHWHAEDCAAALGNAREALTLHRRLGDVAGEASALHNLAEIYRGLGSPLQALEWYEQAMQLHWASKNHVGEILSLFGMANALHQTGDLAGSERKYESAMKLSDSHGERTMQSRALHAIAMLHFAQKNHEPALRFMVRAVEVDRAIGYAHALGHDLVDLSDIHLFRRERTEARAALHEALVWFGFTEDHDALVATRTRIEDLDSGQGSTALPAAPRHGIKSHLPLGEGKVYCEFDSPLTR